MPLSLVSRDLCAKVAAAVCPVRYSSELFDSRFYVDTDVTEQRYLDNGGST